MASKKLLNRNHIAFISRSLLFFAPPRFFFECPSPFAALIFLRRGMQKNIPHLPRCCCVLCRFFHLPSLCVACFSLRGFVVVWALVFDSLFYFSNVCINDAVRCLLLSRQISVHHFTLFLLCGSTSPIIHKSRASERLLRRPSACANKR